MDKPVNPGPYWLSEFHKSKSFKEVKRTYEAHKQLQKRLIDAYNCREQGTICPVELEKLEQQVNAACDLMMEKRIFHLRMDGDMPWPDKE